MQPLTRTAAAASVMCHNECEIYSGEIEKMNDAEAFEMALLAGSNGISAFTVYISFTFGYLVSAFLVGRKLTVSQVIIVSSLYVFSSGSALLALVSSMSAQAVAIAQSPSYPTGTINTAEFWMIYMSVLLGVGIVASLYFMWSTRR